VPAEGYWDFTPEAFMTAVQQGISAPTKAAKSCAEPIFDSKPSFPMLTIISGDCATGMAAPDASIEDSVSTALNMIRNVCVANLTGHPAISLPCGNTSEGLPCGLQLVGASGQTEALLRVALARETHLS